MAFNAGSFGIKLYSEFAKFKFSRIPKLPVEYIITTRGLVVRGGRKGKGDPITWEQMKNPNTSEGLSFLDIDIAGTIQMETPISLYCRGGGKPEKFAKMSTKFYMKLLNARDVALMFKDNPSYQEKALIIWSQKYVDSKKFITKSEYIKEIQVRKIEDMFRKKPEYKKEALEMYERGKLKTADLEETNWEIEQKVQKYITEKKAKQGMGFQPNQSNSSSAADFRNSYRSTTTNSYSHATSRANTQMNKWGNAAPHKRFGSQQGDGR